MGLYTELRCPKCGFTFGCYFYGTGRIKGREEIATLKRHERNDVLQAVYNSLESTITNVDAQIWTYACDRCDNLFQGYRMTFESKVGRFVQNGCECPKCGRYSGRALDPDRLGGPFYGQKTEVFCPECLELMEVAGGGITD